MKRILSLLLSCALVLSALTVAAPEASAESLYIRKIVSVVYDDSGSMSGDKWAYANYAMQAFCGMLNSEDRLFITYMSHSQAFYDYEPDEVDLSAGSIQSSVDSIRGHTDSGSTPYEAVEIAFDKLKSVDDSNPNTQYWLVVITDGVFDECGGMSYSQAEDFLDENFESYVAQTMPNGTKPQLTFLGIQQDVAPTEDVAAGIYTYEASSAPEIIGAMSSMADRISGRTRLAGGSLRQIDEKTIGFSSTIPLLNIAVLSQGSQAEIVSAEHAGERPIPISREAQLSYPRKSGLVGSAYLLGDSQTIIGAGDYVVSFSEAVDLDELVVLFEPALEARMIVKLNGVEIADLSELDSTAAGDKISIGCKIYEMGTNVEIDPDLLPPGTTYAVSISEDGEVVEQSSGAELEITDYELKNLETEISAAVLIEGFSPIERSKRFTPSEYVPKVVYTIEAEHTGPQSIKLDDISSNDSLAIAFTICADGEAMTDPAAVRALGATVSASPAGNGGTTVFSDDGRIIFTPNAAAIPAGEADSFDVEVGCALPDGTSATMSYTVVLADYQVFASDSAGSVKKTELFSNTESVSFYITKDGVRLGKADVQSGIATALNEQHAELLTEISVAGDGTITVRPYSDREWTLNFFSWWINWWRYFTTSGEDIALTLDHSLGSATASVAVEGEDILYQILCVYLPLLIEVAALTILLIWAWLVWQKPKFSKTAKLYTGRITYNTDSMTHTIRGFSKVQLAAYNKLKYGRLKFKKAADAVSIGSLRVRPDYDSRIICENEHPWYANRPIPRDYDARDQISTPDDFVEYIRRNRSLEIKEFATTETITGDTAHAILPVDPRNGDFIVIPDAGAVRRIEDRNVITSGKLIVYINR